MATWKKVLTEQDKATDAAAGVANGETGLVTGNAVFDYITAQNFGTGSGDITNVTVTADDTNTVGAATGDASFTIAGGTNVTTSASGSTLTVNATPVHLASANQTLSGDRTIDLDGNDLTIDPKGGQFFVSDSAGGPTAPEIQIGQGTVTLTANVGGMTIQGLVYPDSDGTNGQVLTTNGSGTLSFTTSSDTHLGNTNLTANGPRTYDQNGEDFTFDPNGGVFSVNDSSSSPSVPELEIHQGIVTLKGNAGSVTIQGLAYPDSDGTNGQVLTTNGSGVLSFGTVANDDVSVSNLGTRLGQINSNVTIGNGTGVGVTIAGDLTVNGTTTTVNSTELLVDDKIITAASGGTTAAGVGTSGLEIDTGDATQLPFVGFVDGAGLTEMVVKAEGNTTAFPIAIMEFSDNSTAPSGDAGGVGSFHFDTGNDTLYIRTA
jgi:hypothetical protein